MLLMFVIPLSRGFSSGHDINIIWKSLFVVPTLVGWQETGGAFGFVFFHPFFTPFLLFSPWWCGPCLTPTFRINPISAYTANTTSADDRKDGFGIAVREQTMGARWKCYGAKTSEHIAGCNVLGVIGLVVGRALE